MKPKDAVKPTMCATNCYVQWGINNGTDSHFMEIIISNDYFTGTDPPYGANTFSFSFIFLIFSLIWPIPTL